MNRPWKWMAGVTAKAKDYAGCQPFLTDVTLEPKATADKMGHQK